MFKPTIAKSVKEYLEAVPSERKDMVLFLHTFIQKTVPTLKSYFATNMIGYGSFEYQNYKKERLSWPVIALANQKQYISVYVCAVSEGGYIAEKYKDELGNVRVGKSCISFKKISDLNLGIFEKVLKEAGEKPGLVFANTTK